MLALALLKLGISYHEAIDMPEVEAVAWLDTYADARNGDGEKRRFKVRRGKNEQSRTNRGRRQ